ncbi:MAG TPA: multiheme c-type cytochrome [Terriglobia bacterium]|nr:multiheme c-type cytochrome [Terriglobia bacterium]
MRTAPTTLPPGEGKGSTDQGGAPAPFVQGGGEGVGDVGLAPRTVATSIPMLESARRKIPYSGQIGYWTAGTLVAGILVAAILLISAACAHAQEFDAVVTEQNRKTSSIADEIPDPAERKAFVELFKKRRHEESARMAEAFLAKYPKSWELAEVYAIAAKAYINLGDYSRALVEARQSLQLYPEDPLLLVPVANVQAQMKRWTEAEESAGNALYFLDRFTRPSSVPERDWPRVKQDLQASAYFALGRAKTGEAFDAAPAQAHALLQKAAQHLTQARQLNPRDEEIAYLLGVVDLGLNDSGLASVSFAAVAAQNGPLQERALNHLQKLYAELPQKRPGTFETYVQNLEAKAKELSRVQPRGKSAQARKVPAYAGSKACRPCHANIYAAWTHTGMARMLRPYQPQNVIGDFAVDNKFYGGDETSFEDGQFRTAPGKHRWLFARMVIRHGRHYFETRDNHGGWHNYPVDYTIGSKWEQGYATWLPDGEIQVFPIQYNTLLKKWVNFWSVIDGPGSPRADLHEWGNMAIWTDYQANCAVCHTSQLRNPSGSGFAPKGVAFREPGIDCEMCHGPSARHAAAMMKGQAYAKRPLEPPVNFSKISAQDSVAICAQCHMQSAVRAPGPHGELNYSTSGEFFTRYKSRPYDEFSHLGFYKDGRFRQTSFIVESLMRSQCFRKGNVTCADCHNVHAANAASNPKSLKFPKESNLMCTQCHSAYKDQAVLARHTHHAAGSEGSHCVSCHMPRIMNALLFLARTHRLDDIPNAGNTLRFGQQDSPNACLLCHTQKGARWVKRQLVAWRESPSPSTGR